MLFTPHLAQHELESKNAEIVHVSSDNSNKYVYKHHVENTELQPVITTKSHCSLAVNIVIVSNLNTPLSTENYVLIDNLQASTAIFGD